VATRKGCGPVAWGCSSRWWRAHVTVGTAGRRRAQATPAKASGPDRPPASPNAFSPLEKRSGDFTLDLHWPPRTNQLLAVERRRFARQVKTHTLLPGRGRAGDLTIAAWLVPFLCSPSPSSVFAVADGLLGTGCYRCFSIGRPLRSVYAPLPQPRQNHLPIGEAALSHLTELRHAADRGIAGPMPECPERSRKPSPSSPHC
jgi:hypothetical protein